VFERPPGPRVAYVGFVDPSGGSADSFAAAIAHRENDRLVLDAVREIRPPFSPEAATKELAGFFRSYGLSTIRGGRYGGEWPREAFLKHGVRYDVAERDCSGLYLELLPVVMSRRASLLDNPRLLGQLASLERRAAVFGRDRIDHPPNAHDDLANAVAGALAMLAASTGADAWIRHYASLAQAPPQPRYDELPDQGDPLPWRPGLARVAAGNELTRLYLETKAEAERTIEGAATCAWCGGAIAAGEASRTDGFTSWHYPRCVAG
jgi:hypothetical protein